MPGISSVSQNFNVQMTGEEIQLGFNEHENFIEKDSN